MSEAGIQARILLACGALPGVRLFRNTVGQGWHGEVVRDTAAAVAAVLEGNAVVLRHARAVTFGLAPGSPDIVGWREVTITPDMVGKTVAQFTGIEVKTPTGRASALQSRFLAVLNAANGFAVVCRSPESAAGHFGTIGPVARSPPM